VPFVDAEGLRTHYRFDGAYDAPVVMLSNSLGTNLAMWDSQIPVLTERYRVLRYDSRGHGHSTVTPGPYSVEQLPRMRLRCSMRLGLRVYGFAVCCWVAWSGSAWEPMRHRDCPASCYATLRPV
jgi:3-oxoadipate enol-lactonase